MDGVSASGWVARERAWSHVGVGPRVSPGSILLPSEALAVGGPGLLEPL